MTWGNTVDLSKYGLSNPEKAFKAHWKDYGFHSIGDGYGNKTETLQSKLKRDSETTKDLAVKGIKNIITKQDDTSYLNDLTGNIPVQFDPEIIQIQKKNAPFLDLIPQEGWSHYTVAVNDISSREDPIGWTGESTSTDMSGESGRDATFTKITADMKIYEDLMDVSDFSQAVGEGYMNVRDTVMGTRTAEHAQWKELTTLYGDPQDGIDDGSPHSMYAYDGLAAWFDDAGSAEDKSGVDISGTDALLKDIKAEMKEILQQGKGINKGDMMILTSHNLKDTLENEANVHARIEFNAGTADYGTETIQISGVPVHASHNVDDWSGAWGGSDTYPGYEGDVFLVNRRSARYRNLAPLSTVPLGRVGLSERAALYEFGTFLLRANGNWGRYLYNYSI